jgi:hypothetical protein
MLLTLTFVVCSCSKEKSSKTSIGQGFEIYMPKRDLHASYGVDYSKIKLDTIELQEIPILKYDDIQKYDTATHTITLPFLKNKLLFRSTSVYGNMFVVTLDKKPIYCGFHWPSISSAIPIYVFIRDVNFPAPDVLDTQIRIGLMSTIDMDPRKNEKLIARLKMDKKILK